MCSNCAGEYENPDATREDEPIVEQVREYIGDGDPLQVLLRDEFMRRKLNLRARAL
jgi:hypothetical protein